MILKCHRCKVYHMKVEVKRRTKTEEAASVLKGELRLVLGQNTALSYVAVQSESYPDCWQQAPNIGTKTAARPGVKGVDHQLCRATNYTGFIVNRGGCPLFRYFMPLDDDLDVKTSL